ncbi:12-oxophytodienoate reductase 1 [Dothidotthia symphoricarpi CBS 119687]|uniref:12-oxophytodienoate reductase 1 n=1 Tax=Dothidotthia symphoricarpi CBS 119687 TaxID=1392245 RepID=A0A6A6AR80_9PLEO|nr:12-oxophytodienoate reductase 1 [Dothidotthia symphoricarpi CBS 119687]KAF2133021.1 12-oxophytodienoate reductase 1 [Dothidotthia symphoricarpi CBS 119687]
MPKADSPIGFKPLKDTALFTPFNLGPVNLEHRIVQAPLTRMRGIKESDAVFVPGDLHVEHYSQRASKGGLQLTEATDIAKYASGYPGVPGVFSESQIAGWKKVTDAVHAKGGYIFCQLWHTGRASPPSFRAGEQTVSSSNVSMGGSWLDGTVCAEHLPRPLTVEEIQGIAKTWGAAAKKAREAGFDGIEIHGANGYLLDQFLHDNVNTRTDQYGGSVENRCRFPLEVIQECAKAIGADRVGIRLSPYNYFQNTKDSNPNEHWEYLCERIATLPQEERPLYVHMVEPRFDEVLDEQAKMDALSAYTKSGGKGVEAEATIKAPGNTLVNFRNVLKEGGVKFLAAGGFNRDNAVPKIESGDADLIIFGRWFIANPDLPKRLFEGSRLNQYDRDTFYGADPPSKGYVDYPFHK